MAARHRERKVVDRVRDSSRPIAEQNRKTRLTIEMIKVGESHVGLRIFAIGENAVLQLADQCLNDRMIRAHDRKAIEGHVLDESAECVLYGVEGTEMIEMLRIDVGDNGDVRAALETCRRIHRPRQPSSHLRQVALVPYALMMPRLSPLGRVPASSSDATSEVVVVLP